MTVRDPDWIPLSAAVEHWHDVLDGLTPTRNDFPRAGCIMYTRGATEDVVGILRADVTALEDVTFRPRIAYGPLKASYDYTLAQARHLLSPGGQEQDARRDADLAEQLHRLRVSKEARRLLDAESAELLDLPTSTRLDVFLAEDDPDPEYRVDQLLPSGGNALFVAPHKAGKTTTVGNLIGAIVDQRPFLGQYATRPGKITLIDDELDQRMLRRWLGEHDIEAAGDVSIVSLRGRVSTFDVLNESIRKRWADLLRGTDLLIIDCLRPLLDALGLDENHDAGRLLVALDELKAAAGISELIVVHHTGHAGERSRGDSRILDWPDAIWKVNREKADDQDSPRYFSAYGRDVDVRDSRLDYDPTTRRLTTTGLSKRDAAVDIACAAVVDLLAEQPDQNGLTQNAIENALHKEAGIPRSDVREGMHRAIQRGLTIVVPGPRNSKLHVLLPQFASSPQFATSSPANSQVSSPPPIGGELANSTAIGTDPSTPTASSTKETP